MEDEDFDPELDVRLAQLDLEREELDLDQTKKEAAYNVQAARIERDRSKAYLENAKKKYQDFTGREYLEE